MENSQQFKRVARNNTPRVNSFKLQIQTHFSLLTQIVDQLSTKYRGDFGDTNKSYSRVIC